MTMTVDDNYDDGEDYDEDNGYDEDNDYDYGYGCWQWLITMAMTEITDLNLKTSQPHNLIT